MSVVECDFPGSSTLSAEVRRAYFHDSYRATLRAPERSVVAIFFALFAHRPRWMSVLLIVRNALAKLCGLEAPNISEIMRPAVKSQYRVGEKIGPWPVFFIAENELVAGRDNKHLDFRLSVLKVKNGDTTDVIVSTICIVHNVFGRIYLFFIVPFHRVGVRALMANAIAARRL
jgi:uncharacterized protein DUF2867